MMSSHRFPCNHVYVSTCSVSLLMCSLQVNLGHSTFYPLHDSRSSHCGADSHRLSRSFCFSSKCHLWATTHQRCQQTLSTSRQAYSPRFRLHFSHTWHACLPRQDYSRQILSPSLVRRASHEGHPECQYVWRPTQLTAANLMLKPCFLRQPPQQ
jgi:hypothetical protein